MNSKRGRATYGADRSPCPWGNSAALGGNSRSKASRDTHGELNELEAANILLGQEWALKARRTKMPGMLSDEYVPLLHKKMYSDVWKWAGRYRQHDTNIGVAHAVIWTRLTDTAAACRSGWCRSL